MITYRIAVANASQGDLSASATRMAGTAPRNGPMIGNDFHETGPRGKSDRIGYSQRKEANERHGTDEDHENDLAAHPATGTLREFGGKAANRLPRVWAARAQSRND